MEKVLLVDDVRLFVEILKGFFEGSDVVVLTATNGHDALAIAEREKPNLIIMDKYMPIMDGVSCCKSLKANPMLRQIPVILLSNDLKNQDIEVYKETGFSDWIQKPVERNVFLDSARKYLNSKLRRDIRVQFSTQVYLAGQDNIPVGMTIDISSSGLCIESDKHFSQGDHLTLTFALQGNDAPIEVSGKVAWMKISGGKSYLGFEFIEIIGKGIPFIRKNDLLAFVKSKSKSLKSNYRSHERPEQDTRHP